MEAKVTVKKERQYYIDWVRILLILSVFLFHVGMVFNHWNWHVKNDIQFENMKYIMSFLHRWRMPLLFLVSGVSTFYALGFRTPKQHLSERFKRLMIPLIAGIFILVPVQVYYEKIDQYDSLFSFYPHMFEGVYPGGNFSWHHLWFIAYLFFIALIISPFLNSMRTNSFNKFKEALVKLSAKKLGSNIFLIPLIVSQFILLPYFPNETHDLVNDWAYISFDLIFFLSGLILFSNSRIAIALKMQRRLYLLEALLSTALMFSVYFIDYGNAMNEVWYYSGIVVAWSCSMAALGYARTYLNKDSTFRKMANEAIYPFYLLHQPIIILIAYYTVRWDISVALKALLITMGSFGLSVGIYWYLIRPFNVLRVIFGLKAVSYNHKSEKLNIRKSKQFKLQA